MSRPNPIEVKTFGDYLDRLNAQTSTEDVELHVDDWPGGRRDRLSLARYALSHFGDRDIICRWARIVLGDVS